MELIFFIEVLAGGLLAGVMYALVATLGVMVLLAVATERVVLRPLVNQAPITLFMATIGLAFVLEGLSQLLWGSQPHGLELGIPDVPMEWLSRKWNVNISQFDLFAAFVAGALVAVLALLFLLVRPEGLFGEKHIDRV